eukprot:scaffold106708_cov17-Tisochrysis_lutea.AAC.1
MQNPQSPLFLGTFGQELIKLIPGRKQQLTVLAYDLQQVGPASCCPGGVVLECKHVAWVAVAEQRYRACPTQVLAVVAAVAHAAGATLAMEVMGAPPALAAAVALAAAAPAAD